MNKDVRKTGRKVWDTLSDTLSDRVWMQLGRHTGSEPIEPPPADSVTGPEIPSPVFDAPVHEGSPTPGLQGNARTYHLQKDTSHTLVVHCGDPRFQKAFHDFVTEELGIENYTPLIIGGGIHAMGVQSFLPKNFKILWEQIKFSVREDGLRQIVIINHEDCLWYEKLQGYHPTVNTAVKGKADLLAAARVIMRDFGGVTVRVFWAGLSGDQIYFTEQAAGQ